MRPDIEKKFYARRTNSALLNAFYNKFKYLCNREPDIYEQLIIRTTVVIKSMDSLLSPRLWVMNETVTEGQRIEDCAWELLNFSISMGDIDLAEYVIDRMQEWVTWKFETYIPHHLRLGSADETGD